MHQVLPVLHLQPHTHVRLENQIGAQYTHPFLFTIYRTYS